MTYSLPNPPPMMKCGHAAHATHHGRNGAPDGPACVICLRGGGPDDPALVVDDAPPDLTGRTARCTYYGRRVEQRGRPSRICDGQMPSSPSSAFFEHKPGEPFDEFYCGCWGWD